VVTPADSATPTGAQAAAAYLRELLLRPGRYRRTWEQYAERTRPGQVNQLAVAEVLARYLWQHPRRRGDGDLLGERAVVAFGQQRPAGIKGLVAAARVGIPDHRVHDDLVTVGVDPGRVAAEDHRQPVGGQPDAAQRPHVVMVERGRLDGDRGPAGRRLGIRPLPRLKTAQRVLCIDTRGIDGKHDHDPSVMAADQEERAAITPCAAGYLRATPSARAWAATAAATAGATRSSNWLGMT